ncbi:hypothetical protein HFO99_25050 [Rhizobium leguminosarum]|uniref:hypothetical protein n=1 Tax=Rhizobium leguminosarum TaxID=384 RepID=UPI001C94139C|nr:hypothetical protein [Rhizobium leguminosarum]MBY5337139.1 hypothetical protein [Rhizobium leguminosarum]
MGNVLHGSARTTPLFEPSLLAIDKEENFSFMPGGARGGRENDHYPVLTIGIETAP